MTISPGATTAAARTICPSPTRIPPPAATSTKKNVPSSSENSRRHSSPGSSHCSRKPNSSSSRCRTSPPPRRRDGRLPQLGREALRPSGNQPTPAVSLSMKWRAKARGRVGRADANHPHVGEGAEAGPPNPHASRRGRDCRRGLRSGRSGRCAKRGRSGQGRSE